MVQQGTDKSLGHDHMSAFVVPVCSAVEGPSKIRLIGFSNQLTCDLIGKSPEVRKKIGETRDMAEGVVTLVSSVSRLELEDW